MVEIDIGAKNIFIVVEQIWLADIQEQAYGYFGLLGIGNVVDSLPIPLTVSYLTNLYYGTATQAT